MNRIATFRIQILIALFLWGTASVARGTLVEFQGIFNGSNPENVQLDISVTNDNNGTEYQSGELNVALNLAIELFALPGNQSSYASMAEMVAQWNVAVGGEVQNGWSSSVNWDGSFSISNAPFGSDVWFATQQNPSQDMQFYTINIPKSQLEFDGIAGYNPLTDK
jgi:hypothetical protein